MAPFEIVQWIVRAALAAAFLFMGVSHFLPRTARTMAAMIPPSFKRPGVPSAKLLVQFTGLCELAGAVGILIPQVRFVAGIALVLFLIAVFPANAYAAGHPEKFGPAAFPFWPRYFAQLGLIALCVVAII